MSGICIPLCRCIQRNNNRNNEEALFIAAGAERNSDAYTNGNYSQSEMFRHFLPSLGTYTDLGLVDKTSNFVYGRPNSNIFLPSKYLMDCFAADMNDSRFVIHLSQLTRLILYRHGGRLMNMEVQRVPKKSQAHLLLNLVFPHLI